MNQREIKFRAWDKKKKEMIYGNHEVMLLGEYVFDMPEIEGNEKEKLYIPMQYTGLKDKDGKEIFEGDLISRKNGEILEVVFDNEDATWTAIRITKEDDVPPMIPDEWYLYNAIEYYGVVGNIYENPELLKKI